MKKSSSKISKNSVSMRSIRSDLSIDSTNLKSNLQEYYRASKEKLKNIKSEIEEIEADNERKKNDNTNNEHRLIELQKQSEELTKEIKKGKSHIADLHKERSEIGSQVRNLAKEIDDSDKKIEYLRLDNQFKMKVVQNDIDHINIMKDTTLKSLRKKKENEDLTCDNYDEKIEEFNDEIKKYRMLIEELTEQDSSRNKMLLKETEDMTKFLENI